VTAQCSVAENYFRDGSVDLACPPLRALLHIMRDGAFEGKNVSDPAIRELFSRETLLASEWYAERLQHQQVRDVRAWSEHIAYVERMLRDPGLLAADERAKVSARLREAQSRLEYAKSPSYPDSLRGCLGTDPSIANG
jgi:hypothetical protein